MITKRKTFVVVHYKSMWYVNVKASILVLSCLKQQLQRLCSLTQRNNVNFLLEKNYSSSTFKRNHRKTI